MGKAEKGENSDQEDENTSKKMFFLYHSLLLSAEKTVIFLKICK
jgi:hypothetical protein